MLSRNRFLTLAVTVVLSACADANQPSSLPTDAPENAKGGGPGGGGGSGITIVDLGILPNRLTNKSSLAFGLNTTALRENVAVVGQSTVNCCNAHAFVWTQAAGISDLRTLLPNGAGSSFGYGVSDNGTIVGASDGPGSSLFRSGFVRPSGGGMTALPLLASGVDGAAQDISTDSKYIVGTNLVPVPGMANAVTPHAVIWDGTSWTAVDSIGPGHALAVSDGRTVVGGTEGAVNRAVVWTDNGGTWSSQLLHTLPSEAWDINPVGNRIAGEREAGGGLVAVVWVKSAGSGTWNPIDLASLGGTVSQALGVSNAGWVVGMSQTASGKFRAALWKPNLDDTYTLLPEDLGSLSRGGESRAYAINENRQVAGGSTLRRNEHGVLWTLPLE
jgi:probable HAF family extracellular repeat protein